jgi:hypothetical protein
MTNYNKFFKNLGWAGPPNHPAAYVPGSPYPIHLLLEMLDFILLQITTGTWKQLTS